jgi:3-methyladenine DNA glycosylase/8-oxoguanine DNA glycosylase
MSTDIQTALAHICASDATMRRLIDAVGPFTLRLERRRRFSVLARAVISQQVSTAAARTIRERKDLYAMDDLADKKTCMQIAAPWRPYATIGPWYCWRALDLKRNIRPVAEGYPT